MTLRRGNFAVARSAQRRDFGAPAMHFLAAALLLVGAAVFTSTSLRAETTSEDSSPNQVFELPQSAGTGDGKEVSVVIDNSYLKLVTLALRDGTVLPPHAAPVPTTIQVLEGEGVMHFGGEVVSVSKGTLISLAGGEEHSVVPEPGRDMLASGPLPAPRAWLESWECRRPFRLRHQQAPCSQTKGQ